MSMLLLFDSNDDSATIRSILAVDEFIMLSLEAALKSLIAYVS